MPNRQNDPLLQLINSLQKAEKRNFKLFSNRNSGTNSLKVVQLFDALDKFAHLEDEAILKKLGLSNKNQLANLKAHLYRQILASLRIIKANESIEIEMHEQLDNARILYNKGLLSQALKVLERLKEQSKDYHQDAITAQTVSLEKKIETLHITRSTTDRAEQLSEEALLVSDRRKNITLLSNLALQLYSWYVKNGHTKNEEEEVRLLVFLDKRFAEIRTLNLGFYEKLNLYQCRVWSAFIRQDFVSYYKFTQKWVDLFYEDKKMIKIETMHYVKGMHNLLNALFDLRYYKKNYDVLEQFKAFAQSDIANHDEHVQMQTFIYLHSAKFNRYISTGSFYKGIQLIPGVVKKLKEYEFIVDEHRGLVLNYKIATIYFGYGDYDKCIDFLRLIINDKPSLRADLQSYARLLHLIAHYELGNYDIMESLIKSVYRFMAKVQHLTIVEKEMFKFLRSSFNLNPRNLTAAFEQFYERIKQFENSRFEVRATAYLDIHSWIESKINHKTMGEIIKEKYLNSKRK